MASCAALAGCGDDDEPSSWDYLGPDAGSGQDADSDTDAIADDSAFDVETPDAPDVDASDVDAPDVDAPDVDLPDTEAGLDAEGPCPEDMTLVDGTCIDRFEAPNREGALPLVMFHFDEAASWCEARDKRLCYDDEWTRVCGGIDGDAYPYGNVHDPGVCNDDKVWLEYKQTLLSEWPWSIDTDPIESVDELLDAARAMGASGTEAADHVAWLYQGTPSGSKVGCTTGDGAFDLAGNVEEWTRRRSGGTDGFHGNLKGRYWAEARTCQQSVITHGDLFRFYEIGFRCCRDPK